VVAGRDAELVEVLTRLRLEHVGGEEVVVVVAVLARRAGLLSLVVRSYSRNDFREWRSQRPRATRVRIKHRSAND
jgi:hypothetical protein